MWCIVYRLYDGQGNRLPIEVAKANGKRGWLVYRDSAPVTGMPYWHAVLLPHEGASDLYPVIPELRHASRKVCDGGIRFRGQDFVYRARLVGSANITAGRFSQEDNGQAAAARAGRLCCASG
jgi:hypothetical protein